MPARTGVVLVAAWSLMVLGAGPALAGPPEVSPVASASPHATAYVANGDDGTVTPIDIADGSTGSAINVGGFPDGVAITPDGKTAYVVNGATELGGTEDTVMPINVATNVPGAAIPVGFNPGTIAITPDGKTAYVVNFSDDTVTPVNTGTNTPGSPISVGGGPSAIAITPDQAPTAAFSLTAAAAGSPSSFDASAASSVLGTITGYAWDFGDGQTATTPTPQTTHTYSTAGDYTVRLTVTDSAGTSL